jgi:hypothetical protein
MENANEISILDILELAHNLRQEKLSIETEMNDYFRLQVKLNDNSFEAIKIAWILAIHRQNLNSLIVSKPENRPSLCCQRATQLENVEFVDAYRDPAVKSQHLPLYVDFLRFVHQSPQLLAHCLAVADDLPGLGTASTASKADQMSEIAQIISASLYGNSIHGRDVEMMLKLLDRLLEMKITTTDDPGRLLRQSSSSFARLYHKFHESSLSSKLFLTAALHEPVMSVLINDAVMLSVDHAPGIGGDDKMSREEMIDTLFTLSSQFIQSLSANWIIFPSTIRWLVQTMSKYLHAKGCESNTILEILTDMVFGHFICPACTNPNLYGITDAHISEIARFNLIQIGQILQKMALARHQNVEKKFMELYNKFDQNVVSDLMDKLLENTYDISEMGLSHQLPTLYNIGRGSILITQAELSLFLQFLRASIDSQPIDTAEKKKLKSMLDGLPTLIIDSLPAKTQNGSIETSPNKRATKLMQQLSKSSKSKMVKNPSASSLNDENAVAFGELSSEDTFDRVLIIPLSIYENTNKMRPLSEDEVLNMNQVPSERTDTNSLTEKNIEELSRRNEDDDDDDINSNETRDKEKQTKFMNQDDVSIGNTSDNLELEAVSEAPSNHSVASSLDLEENNDNLSDMVSANVSGRGTPNISGRDTPSSQVIDGGELVQQIPTPQMAKIINKARNDIEDKFCKFEIKKLIEGDETISIISDTWSTDVLASDSETIEANERNFSTPLIPSSVIIPDAFQLRTNNFDMSETQSESAWSTDVLIASDSEKNGEIDNDDTQSITTRSDITESTTPRDQEVPNTNHTPESPFYAPPRVPNIHFRPIDPTGVTPRTPDSPFSFRSSEESPRPIEPIARDHFNRARPVARGGSQGPLFSSNFNYLATPSSSGNFQNRPFRQHSNESQSSLQSEQEPKHKSPTREKKPERKEFIDSQQQQPLSVFRVSDPNLENFSTGGGGGRVIKTSVNLINPFMTSGGDQTKASNNEDGEPVEHRRLSDEQRSVSYDSRRNGMVDLMSSPIVLSSASNNPFDVPLSQIKPQQLAHVVKANSIDIDGDLCVKTEGLKLNDAGPSSSTGAISKIPNGSVKNHKATGAIPKSISFDSTADKAERNQNRRSEGGNRHLPQSTGIFNKIRQGFKKRGKARHSIDETVNTADLLLNGSSNRSVAANGFIEAISTETSDDILAKYRRKPSSSSDAATSDSAGSSNNSSSLKSKSSDNENR